MIGARLKLARSGAGLSLRALEDKIGGRVTAQAIGKYERNQSMPGSGVLLALAEALDVPVDYLLSSRETVLEEMEFRKKNLACRREEAQVRTRVLHLVERYLLIEEVLNLPSIEWNRPRKAPYPVRQSLEEAERAATSLREHWNLGMYPIPNLSALLEEQGVKVLAVQLTHISGIAARVRHQNGRVPVIALNQADCGERQRFTLAHELGHLVMDTADYPDPEKAAHRFAGAFLMPADAFRGEVGSHRTCMGGKEFLYLKRLFGVSIQAIAHRCRDLGIFKEKFFRQLHKEFKRLGWAAPPYKEPEESPGEAPQRFRRLVYRALAEDAISEAKAAELLDMSARELDWMMVSSREAKGIGDKPVPCAL